VDLYLEQETAAGRDPDEMVAQGIVDLLNDPLQEEALGGVIQTLAPTLNAARARKAARELILQGETTLPLPYLAKEGPEILPLRIYQDVFVPPNTLKIHAAMPRVTYLRFWLQEYEVRERAARESWNPDFTAELLGDEEGGRRETGGAGGGPRGHEGRSGFEDLNTSTPVTDFYGEADRRRGLWELIVALYPATNADGVVTLVTQAFSAFCDAPATGPKPYTRSHGKYPIVWFTREDLTERLMDTRGVPEVTGTDQKSYKLHRDTFEDHTQVATLPPIRRPPNRPNFTIDFEPMGSIESTPSNPTEFMRPPEYPRAADAYLKRLDAWVARYHGRAHPEVPEVVTQIRQQDRIDGFLGNVGRVVKLAVQLCQQKMPTRMLMRIAGGNGLPIARSRQEIAGSFDLIMAFDVRDLDWEKLVAKGKMMIEYVKVMDTRARVQWDGVSARMMQAIDPSWADEFVMPAERADEREVMEEKAALAQMLNGIRPEMPEGGINAQLRLETLMGELEPRRANPQAFAPMTQAAMLLIGERVKYLRFQVQQGENAVTGRLGVDTGKTDAEIKDEA